MTFVVTFVVTFAVTFWSQPNGGGDKPRSPNGCEEINSVKMRTGSGSFNY